MYIKTKVPSGGPKTGTSSLTNGPKIYYKYFTLHCIKQNEENSSPLYPSSHQKPGCCHTLTGCRFVDADQPLFGARQLLWPAE